MNDKRHYYTVTILAGWGGCILPALDVELAILEDGAIAGVVRFLHYISEGSFFGNVSGRKVLQDKHPGVCKTMFGSRQDSLALRPIQKSRDDVAGLVRWGLWGSSCTMCSLNFSFRHVLQLPAYFKLFLSTEKGAKLLILQTVPTD